jgi:hemoglobin
VNLPFRLSALACIAVGCGGAPTPPSPVSATPAQAARPAAPKGELYDRLGGQRAIVAVVDDFIGRVAADGRIKFRFANTDIPRLKSLLVEFVCMATGGPCKYSGQDMETSHAGMDLVHDEFAALVDDLAATLDKFKVPAKEKGELLGALGGMKGDIVGK